MVRNGHIRACIGTVRVSFSYERGTPCVWYGMTDIELLLSVLLCALLAGAIVAIIKDSLDI